MIEDLQSLVLCQLSFLFYVFCQSTSITVLIYQIIVVSCPKHLYKLYDIRMIYFRQYCNLVICELTEFRCMFELLNIHNLNSIVEMSFLVFSLINIAVLSLSYFLDKNVIFNDFVHWNCNIYKINKFDSDLLIRIMAVSNQNIWNLLIIVYICFELIKNDYKRNLGSHSTW